MSTLDIDLSDEFTRGAALIKEYITLESNLASLYDYGEAPEELKQIATVINSLVLGMNDSYLEYLDKHDSAAGAAKTADAYVQACESRKHRALENSDNLDSILRVYGPQLSNDSRVSKTSNTDLDLYTSYIHSLLKAKYGDVPVPPKKLVKIWVEEYSRTHSTEDEGEGIETGEVEESPICPISRVLLVNPVRAPCGHVFSEASANSVFTSRTRCPSTGCLGDFTRNELIRDYLMDVRVELWKQKHDVERQHATLGLETI